MIINIGKGLEIDVDFDKMPETVLKHAIVIGVTNMLRDCHAGETLQKHGSLAKQREVSMESAKAKLARLYAGESNGGGRQSVANALRDENAKLRAELEAFKAAQAAAASKKK